MVPKQGFGVVLEMYYDMDDLCVVCLLTCCTCYTLTIMNISLNKDSFRYHIIADSSKF